MSALGGSFGLGSIGGIGTIISSISSLFGGGSKKTLPPLVSFSLPNAKNETLHVGAQGSPVSYQSGVTQQATSGPQASSAYSPSVTSSQPTSTVWIQNQSTQIAQAVKTALLNSSSLNDVISEL